MNVKLYIKFTYNSQHLACFQNKFSEELHARVLQRNCLTFYHAANTKILPNILVGKCWKICGNCAFPQNFHTRILDEISVFYVVSSVKKYLQDTNILYTLFLISQTFISNTRPKLTKSQAKAKQHPEAEFLLFENYSLFSFMSSPKINKRYSKKCKEQMCLF